MRITKNCFRFHRVNKLVEVDGNDNQSRVVTDEETAFCQGRSQDF